MPAASHTEILQHWRNRLLHWGKMFAGTSYYHQQQGVGRVFRPGKLEGYFNDLSGKTNWHGETAVNGLPVTKLSNGKAVHFPTLLCQKALGHWDLWLLQAGSEDREKFLGISRWLVETQDANGGWDTLGLLDRPHRYRYSAMTQGQAVSVMARAHALSSDKVFADTSGKAVALMQKPVPKEGVCCYEGENVILEEFPDDARDTVLNGWVFALFGLYDYLLQFPDEKIRSFYDRSLASLARSLAEFDSGYWSYYSSGTKRIASPFYHRLHLAQLEALAQAAPREIWSRTITRWRDYERNRLCKSRAVFRKAMQKLTEPAEVTVIG